MSPPRLRVVTALVTGLVVASPPLSHRADAQETCDVAEVAELREHLAVQARSAARWNLTWRLLFTGAAIGTGALAAADPWPSMRAGLIASSGKAAVGAAARWLVPLTVRLPPSTADACVELATLRAEVARVARKERQLFVMSHLGGIVVNLAGAAYVWHQDSLDRALLSIAVGYPIGILSTYTMPRATWRLHRRREAAWSVGQVQFAPRADGRGWALSLSGTF